LVVELVLTGNVDVRDSTIVVISRTPPEDALAHSVLDRLLVETVPQPVRTWLVVLAQSALADVAQRLERAGYLSRAQPLRLRRSTVHWVPIQMTAAFAPLARLRNALVHTRPMSVADGVLAGLAVAAGLDGHVLWHTDPAVRRYLDWVVGSLPPPLPELVAQTAAAVGSALLSHRM
jgi:hypothetical protein